MIKIRKFNINARLLSGPQSAFQFSHIFLPLFSLSRITHRVEFLYLIFSVNLEQFLSLSLSFLTLAFLKSTGYLLCRVPLNLSLSDVSS